MGGGLPVFARACGRRLVRAGQGGGAARLLAAGILLVMLGVAWLLFDGPGPSDIVLAALTALAIFR